MTNFNTVPSIDECLRERLMPVEGAIPHLPGIEEHTTRDHDHLRQIGEEDRIDDKTVFIIKRT